MKKVLFVLAVVACTVASCSKKAANEEQTTCCGEKKECCAEKKECCKAVAEEAEDVTVVEEAPAETIVEVEESVVAE